MLQLYRSIHPYVIFLVIFTAGILWIPVFIQPDLFYNPLDVSLSPILKFSGFHDRVLPVPLMLVLGFVFWNLVAFQISQLNGRHLFMESRNFLPALFFILSSGWMPGMQQLNSALLGLVFVVMGVDRIFRSYEESSTRSNYFDTGILMGLGSLIYLPYLIFFPLVWIAVIVSRSIRFRNFSNSFFGFITPWWIMYGLIFFIQGEITEINEMLKAVFQNHAWAGLFPYQFIVFGMVGLILVLGSIQITSSQPFKKVRYKRFFIILFWIFVVMTGGFLFLFGDQVRMLIAISFPLSYLIANYFTHAGNAIHNQLLFLIYLLVMTGYPYFIMFRN